MNASNHSKSKRLLVVSPHFKLFIRNQIVEISHFYKTAILVSQPYFPKSLLNIPYFERKYPFLKNAVESCSMSNYYSNISVICPKFFALPIEVIRKRIPSLSTRSSIKALKKKSIEYDLIHAHRLDIGFTGAVLKNLSDKPLIITCHGSDVYDFPFKDDFRYAIAKYTINRVDHIIAVCSSDAEKLLFLGLPSSKLSIIPNGFDDDLFKPIPQRLARAELGLPYDKKILLSVGTLHEVKGYDYLIDAIYVISKVRDDIVTVIVGSGPLELKLRKKIEKLGLTQRVLLVGWVSHNKIPLWMNASDLFVLPSLDEGFPTVIPEAMACGKPVIGTRVGGIPDAISDNVVGIIINSRDREALAQGILEALNRKWEPEKIRRYAQKYSLKTVATQILQVYQHVLYS